MPKFPSISVQLISPTAKLAGRELAPCRAAVDVDLAPNVQYVGTSRSTNAILDERCRISMLPHQSRLSCLSPRTRASTNCRSGRRQAKLSISKTKFIRRYLSCRVYVGYSHHPHRGRNPNREKNTYTRCTSGYTYTSQSLAPTRKLRCRNRADHRERSARRRTRVQLNRSRIRLGLILGGKQLTRWRRKV
jgi:hypothetical protein